MILSIGLLIAVIVLYVELTDQRRIMRVIIEGSIVLTQDAIRQADELDKLLSRGLNHPDQKQSYDAAVKRQRHMDELLIMRDGKKKQTHKRDGNVITLGNTRITHASKK